MSSTRRQSDAPALGETSVVYSAQMRRRSRWLMVGVVVGTLAGCGSADEAAEPAGATDAAHPTDPTQQAATTLAAGTAVVVLAVSGVDDQDEMDATLQVLRQRFDALGVDDVVVEASDDRIRLTLPVDGVDLVPMLVDVGQVFVRPVQACTFDGGGEPVDVVSDPTSEQLLPLVGGGTCVVGPAGATGEVFEPPARAEPIGDAWGVLVELKAGPAGLDPFNELAAVCFEHGPSCPSGQLAIEVDGSIISAPMINVPSFDAGELQIAGSFTEADAVALARTLDIGALGVRLDVVSTSTGY